MHNLEQRGPATGPGATRDQRTKC